ncbi:MAG: sigma-54 dependent transcriptional regulator [Candidatus Latescibacterota bacterium]|jgi:DNA-binding NtrC family response regulator
MPLPNRVLLVDDEERLRRILARLLIEEQYEVAEADTGEQAVSLAATFQPDVVVMDQNLPGISGQEATTAILEQSPGVKVIVITAYGAIEQAVDAMRRGAHDYLTKPFDNEVFLLRVRRALEARRLTQRVELLQEALGERYSFSCILGQSQSLQAAIRQAQRAAASEVPVLVVGESGTGKELLVRALHQASSRRDGPFVAVNCAAVPAELVESAFFGHRKGAFTGAGEAHQGWFAQAHGGTLFLDEIAEMPAALQAKLLRVLEDGQVTPVGATTPAAVDVRLVAATNRAVDEAVRQGVLREDLYHRLAVVSLRLPPLRERPEDIPLLADHFLALARQQHGARPSGFSAEALARLRAYPWPGNVRELRNAVQSAAIMADGEKVDLADLPPAVQDESGPAAVAPGTPSPADDLSTAVAGVERELIARILAEEAGNRTRAAERLGITRKTLVAKLVQHGLA